MPGWAPPHLAHMDDSMWIGPVKLSSNVILGRSITASLGDTLYWGGGRG